MTKKIKTGQILLLSLVLASALIFIYRLQTNFYQTPIDFLIFLKAAKNYQQSGELYQRAENYGDKYHPSAAIFKFPPPFELALLPLTKVPKHIDLLKIMKILLSGMYFLSLWLIFLHLKNTFRLSAEKQFTLASCLAITGFWFMPYFESIRWLLAEIPLLLIFVVSFLLLQHGKKSAFCSGILIAYASCIKIYPVFMAGQFIVRKNMAALAGMLTGLIAIMTISIVVFGAEEHIFYFSNILPVLLKEEVTGKWINLNLEKFLFALGLISNISGNIFQAFRLLFLLAFLGIWIQYRETLLKNAFLGFSLFITTMFFCFPNYWPQYQIFLLIPIAYLLANHFRKDLPAQPWIIMAVIVTLCVPDNLHSHPFLISNTPLLKIAALLLYEARALAPLMLWILLAREIHLQQKTLLS